MHRSIITVSKTSPWKLRIHPRIPFKHSLRHATSYATSAPDTLPRVAQPSIWHSIVPKFLRERRKDSSQHVPNPQDKRKEWNPYTFFIIIFLLIGSNAINLLALRKEFGTFSRQADAKIALLKETIERVQAGEDVDVKRILGTGDPKQEQEWEEVLREIEAENEAPSLSKKKIQSELKEQKADKRSAEDSQTQISAETEKGGTEDKDKVTGKSQIKRSASFY